VGCSAIAAGIGRELINTGTTSAEHMTTDPEAQKLKLEATEIADIERLIA